jgi:hypothetical protein
MIKTIDQFLEKTGKRNTSTELTAQDMFQYALVETWLPNAVKGQIAMGIGYGHIEQAKILCDAHAYGAPSQQTINEGYRRLIDTVLKLNVCSAPTNRTEREWKKLRPEELKGIFDKEMKQPLANVTATFGIEPDFKRVYAQIGEGHTGGREYLLRQALVAA